MRIINDDKCMDYKYAVALGNFDGLHTAHTTVIESTCRYAREHNALSCVLLFRNHTKNVTAHGNMKLLTVENEKLYILQELGVDAVYICDFDNDFMRLSPADFVLWLKDTLNPAAVSVGYDYRFGCGAEGNVHTLSELGVKYGFEVLVQEEIMSGDDTVKSTKIREHISNGNIDKANILSGRSYFIIGEVVHGLENGRRLAFPTANISYADNKLLPKTGVYMGYTTVDGKKYKSMINVGNNPTFNADKITVESHILDFEGDIYGKTVRCEFVKRIRDEKKFGSVNELIEQIKSDIDASKREEY